jgi:hypothetical protein
MQSERRRRKRGRNVADGITPVFECAGPLIQAHLHMCIRGTLRTRAFIMIKNIHIWVCCFIIQGTHARLVLKIFWIPHVRLCVWSTHTVYRFTQLCFANKDHIERSAFFPLDNIKISWIRHFLKQVRTSTPWTLVQRYLYSVVLKYWYRRTN